MAGIYQSWGRCRRCRSEVVIRRKYGGLDRRKSGYNCGTCWFRDVALPMIEYAARVRGRRLQLVLFPRRRRA
jgi:hypothetical protein